MSKFVLVVLFLVVFVGCVPLRNDLHTRKKQTIKILPVKRIILNEKEIKAFSELLKEIFSNEVENMVLENGYIFFHVKDKAGKRVIKVRDAWVRQVLENEEYKVIVSPILTGENKRKVIGWFREWEKEK